MTRSATLKAWPPEQRTIDAMQRWRDHLVDHLKWIQTYRGQNVQYGPIAGLYRRQLVSVSFRLARAQAMRKKPAAKAA